MRLIDADELLKVTVKRNGIWNAITNSSGEGLEEIINSQPTIEISKWISVKDRLPEDYEEVWITDVEGNVERARFYKEPYPEDGEKDRFACRTYLVYVENVLAWQPILKPEPYKEGE